MTIHGVDLSDFDRGRGPVDVAAMARDGIAFLTHKATEGTRTRHAFYGQTLNAARAAGIPLLGAYVVPRTPGNNGHGSIPAQVDYFLSYLDAQTPWWRSTPEFFLQVDTEHWGYDDVHPRYGAEACALLRSQTGKWVIHYAPRWAYGDTIPGDDPLWASAYGANPAVPYRQAYPGDSSTGWAPYSGRTPTFLQFGSKTRIGTQPGCDANAFRGSETDLRALVAGDELMAAADDLAEIRKMLGAIYTMDLQPSNSLGWWIRRQIAETQLPALLAAIVVVGKQLGVAQADLDAIQARVELPVTVTIPPEHLDSLADRIAATLIASGANGLTINDHSQIVEDVKRAFREGADALPDPGARSVGGDAL